LQVAEIFADLRLAETFARDEKPSDGTGIVLDEPLPDQVPQTHLSISANQTHLITVNGINTNSYF